jgi:hypothetical protein
MKTFGPLLAGLLALLLAGDEFVVSLGAGRTVSVQGALRYQACDTQTSGYLPEKAKVLWEVGGAAGPGAVAGTDPAQVRMRSGYRGPAVWECDAAGIVIGWEWWGAGFPGFSDRAIEGALA